MSYRRKPKGNGSHRRLATSNRKRLPISLMDFGSSEAVRKDRPKKTGVEPNRFSRGLEHNQLSAPDSTKKSGRDFVILPDSDSGTCTKQAHLGFIRHTT